ncbi:hypothetical protein [Halobacillus sp. BBL2006]|uniref:hypothetical protein n=1 Tax=Halobacillus sp. BBL2006 TaxID=1543706 RepID=UPI000541DE3D|nr:hypothetical protein [Halobacillus sp. BBL2006]KHE67070.1 hypothetical protein LD39_19470 [Halobacillus sp. BBL2006]
MSMNHMDDFLYQLKKYMEYTTELRSSYEHLSEHEKSLVVEASPTKNSPETIAKQAYTWHDDLFERLNKTR